MTTTTTTEESTMTGTTLTNVPACGHKQFAFIERGTDPNNPDRFWVFLADHQDEKYFYKSLVDFETAHAKATWRISFCLACRCTWKSINK